MKTLILEEFSCDFDREADVLYISFGNPVESYCDEVSDGILVRHSFDTDEVSGITLIDYSKKKMRKTLNFCQYFTPDICEKIDILLSHCCLY